MQQAVLAYIRSQGMLNAGDRVGAAVSGGADSVAMLRVLLDLRSELAIVLSVVHFNHKIRGAEADADERFVAELAHRHDLEFHHSSADVPAYAAAHRLSLETAARHARYDYFHSLLGSAALDAIATGHTADDQAETVLMRLIRGAGTTGLAGIRPVQSFAQLSAQASGASLGRRRAVIRPMLCVRRRDVESYLRELAQPWKDDPTNFDPRHFRNRIRHQLLPLLERDFNPSIVRALTDLALIARDEEDFFAGYLKQIFQAGASAEPLMAVPLDSFLGLPRAIQRRWLRSCAESLGITLEFRHVEALLELAAGESSNREGELPGGWVAVRSNRELNFEPRSRARQEPPPYDYRLPVPGEVTVAETGSLFRAILCPARAAGAGYNREQFLDARALPPELTVRNWRPGDRFWPAHSKAPRKVKELLQEKRISGRDRAQWPVVVSRDKVVFLRGFGPAADLLLPDGDAAGILIEEVRPTGETCPTR